ncbi:hypothetical protein Tchl_2499 [Thauera chlorobenzoica]|uniref:Uncharacterized protein n=1 Tax=Thauera chlorobenzoica TaxID=96773 RepID=A0A1L6FEY7_9RHOO|nr:hypothetical protein Tchl_2499 [Thauera chlorobenzoica]
MRGRVGRSPCCHRILALQRIRQHRHPVHLRRPQFLRMSLAVKEDEPPYPINVRLHPCGCCNALRGCAPGHGRAITATLALTGLQSWVGHAKKT